MKKSTTLKELVAARLDELGRNPFEAARIGGLERSFVNDILIEKKTSVRGQNLSKLAFGLDWPTGKILREHVDQLVSSVVVRGLIGAGAEIFMEAEQIGPEGLEEIELAIVVSPDALAFRVQGESMYPRYDDGDIVICGRDGIAVEELVNWEAAVRTSDGRRFLKRLRRGSRPGLFDLESHNAAPMRGMVIEWASVIEHVVRSGQWKTRSSFRRSANLVRK